MAWFGREREPEREKARGPVLVVEGLDVYYGRAHALQGVNLSIDQGVLGIVGRNGMGKTTLCNAITGLVPARGSIRLVGEEILGLAPNEITKRGIAYVPQGRRVWPSLSVDETLRLVAGRRREVDRVYAMFPRLAERRGHGGAQLSGGEQQMLAIGRALLLNPRLLVMDEPTEGLAPVIVEQVAQALRELAAEGRIAVLLIEQNLGVAISVADRIGLMVNGRIAREMPAAELAADRELQERLLGVRSGGEADELEDPLAAPPDEGPPPTQVFTVRRAHGDGAPSLDDLAPSTVRGFTRWNAGGTAAPVADIVRLVPAAAPEPAPPPPAVSPRVFEFPVAASSERSAYVVGTFDTKGRELAFLRQCIEKLGLRVVTVDLSTSGKPSPASVHPPSVRSSRSTLTAGSGIHSRFASSSFAFAPVTPASAIRTSGRCENNRLCSRSRRGIAGCVLKAAGLPSGADGWRFINTLSRVVSSEMARSRSRRASAIRTRSPSVVSTSACAWLPTSNFARPISSVCVSDASSLRLSSSNV